MSIGLNLLSRLLLIAAIVIFHAILGNLQRYNSVRHFAACVCHGTNDKFRKGSTLGHLLGSTYSVTLNERGGLAKGRQRTENVWRRTRLRSHTSFGTHPKLLSRRTVTAYISGRLGNRYRWPINGGRRRWRVHILPDQEKHRMLKDLYLKRKEHLDTPPGEVTNYYRYFNITTENVEHHLNVTMDEFFENEKEKVNRPLYIVDGNSFSGRYYDLRLPVPREWASYEFQGQNPNAQKPLSQTPANVEPKFDNELLSSIYEFISGSRKDGVANESDTRDPNEGGATDTEGGKKPKGTIKQSITQEEKRRLIDLYDEVGDYEYETFENFKVYRKDYLQDLEFKSDENAKKQRELLHRVMTQPTRFPSYLDPANPVLRTGRRRELQRKRDSGRLQRQRWHMDVAFEDDILRGRRRMGDNVTKEFMDSIEWEQPLPTYHDRNFFKRSFYEGGFGDEDRTIDSYFDAQFIGSTDAYPFAVSAGMQFAWPIYWVPMLSKTHPKRRGQPIRSQMFNLGGVEPLQLWFYPEGTASSIDGYCSLKLVSPPGWCLPYRIYLFVFSEYNRVVLGPMFRESPDYVSSSLNTCRLVGKENKNLLKNSENDSDYVILGPSGNVYVGVGIVDESLFKRKDEYEFKYDWDEGDYDFNQWLKKQTSDPDDQFTQDHVTKDQTHSIWYESHKYRYVPDRHISRYWRTRYTNSVRWSPPDF